MASRSDLTGIPCTWMRGGTSKGAFFLATDLPAAPEARDRILLAALGSPDPRQIDGIGGGDPLTSKVGIISSSQRPGIDVDYLFAQVLVDRPVVDVSPNCGNLLAAVGPFAIEHGLVAVTRPTTQVSIFMVNTGTQAVATVLTPNGLVQSRGTTTIAGVPRPGAPIHIAFTNTVGSTCDTLLPTGQASDRLVAKELGLVASGAETVTVTCIDNGMPVVVVRAADLGKTGYESPAELDADAAFKARLEQIRVAAGARMGLGDVGSRAIPKITLVAPPCCGGQVHTRTFIPHRCHSAIGVLGAVSVASACLLPGSVARDVASPNVGNAWRVEHPSGDFDVTLEATSDSAGKLAFGRCGVVRTARMLMRGTVFIPATEAAHGAHVSADASTNPQHQGEVRV